MSIASTIGEWTGYSDEAIDVTEYRCTDCGGTFESAKSMERVQCLECLSNDFERGSQRNRVAQPVRTSSTLSGARGSAINRWKRNAALNARVSYHVTKNSADESPFSFWLWPFDSRCKNGRCLGSGQFGLEEAVSIALGGMIGGGIYAVLGVGTPDNTGGHSGRRPVRRNGCALCRLLVHLAKPNRH